MCEVFEQNKCNGCVALDPQYNIDEVKKYCEIYQEWRNLKEILFRN